MLCSLKPAYGIVRKALNGGGRTWRKLGKGGRKGNKLGSREIDFVGLVSCNDILQIGLGAGTKPNLYKRRFMSPYKRCQGYYIDLRRY